ncbi:MAG TPA: tetratricopeptide repeat protein [Leptospiraceae bacterium]|nr:tetratricopeptide repeat protein [Leptospiraceae bacterium]HMW04070.1 tetratricopeptide repeat protein [Leptospiraceae bacterium]HMX30863.1 tetratricopeptide repeat protein [Leptospiraceae bacterium]HMY30064.1 tetratricopeptide repeat protein [Leptospiraceae bacterium]HMZ62749.1 tetratricopeptide repeat protein [Leptospiraceae bacterium]
MKKNILFYILLCLCGLISLAAQDKEAGEYIQLGEKFLKEKNYREALVSYKQALIKNPGSIRANLGFAKSSLNLGSKQDAETGFKRTLELDSKNREAIAGLAEIQADLGKYKEAMDLLESSLKEEPYNPELLLARAYVLLKAGKNKLALIKLEEAKKRVVQNYEFKLLLAKVYIANKDFKKANQIVDDLIAKHPENPNSFNQKAILNFEMLKDSSDTYRLMKETYTLLHTALSLDGNNHESKRLLIKNLLWLGKFDTTDNLEKYAEAKKITLDLLHDYPNDPYLQYISGYISYKLNHGEDSAENYLRLLELQELNELGRFSAENYAISKLNENHTLRVTLGKYRLDRYRATRNEYLYNEAFFHLKRAEKLIPTNSELKQELLEYYYRNGDLYRLLHYLTKMRDDNVDDMKIHNRLENVYHKYKQTLIYREGFTSESGRMNQGFRTEPEIFIFDPEPDKSLYTYPDASLQIANAIKFAISLHPNLKLISGSEEAQIRNAIKKKKGVEAYTESVYYSPDSIDILDIDRKEGSRIRYIAYGTFTEDKNNLTVRYKIYDRVSGKIIDTINTTASNRNSIAEISVRVAKRISNSIPLDGRIIKINQDGVIVNLGTKDGIDKDFILEAVIPGQDNIKMKVITVDEYVSKAIPEEKGWGKNLSLRDRIIVVGKKNNEKDSEKK